MQAIVKFFLKQRLMVNLITIFVIIVGSMVALNMRRTAFPDVDMGYVKVSTIYEGATALEVEQLVTDKLEDAIENVDGIKHFYSSSFQNRSEIFVEVEIDSDTSKVVEDIKNEVNNVKDLPEEAEDPDVKELNMHERALLGIALWGPEELTLRDYADELETRIEEISGVSKVEKGGYRDREIHVEVNLKKLEENRLAISDVITAIETSSKNIPSGSIDGKEKEILIRTIGEAKNAEAVGNIFLRVNDAGKSITVKDVANVKDSFEDVLTTYRADGHPAIALNIKMKKSGDAINISRNMWKVLNKYREEHPDVNYTKGLDFSFFIQRRLNVLKANGILGLAFVVILLLLFLNWRIALCTALGIPVAFLGAMFILQGMGMSINMLSMLGLIIVLGMLVDDAIVVAENIYQKLEKGMEKRKAAYEGTLEVIAPVSGTIITTMAAFLPLLLMAGIMGKFMKVVPVVVIAALFMSWLESMFILPSHIIDFAGKGKITKKFNWFKHFRSFYGRFLKVALKMRYLVFLSLILLLGFSIYLMRSETENFEMFPKQLIDTVFMKIESSEGTSREKMAEIIKNVEKELLSVMYKNTEKDKEGNIVPMEIRSIIIKHGSSKESGLDPHGGQGDEYAFGRIEMTGQKFRERKGLRMAEDIMNILREKTEDIEGLKEVAFETHKPGPPAGKPLALEIKGKNFENMSYVANRIEDYLKSIPEVEIVDKKTGQKKMVPVVHDIGNSIATEKDELSVIVDKKRASEANINTIQIAAGIRQAFTGRTAATINLHGEEIEIIVRLNEEARKQDLNLQNIKILNSKGMRIPLKSIAEIKKTKGLAAVFHRDGKRVTYLNGEVLTDVIKPVALTKAIKNNLLAPKQKKETATKTNKKPNGLKRLMSKMFSRSENKFSLPEAVAIDMPEDVIVSAGGEAEMADEAIDSMKRITIAAILLIFFILAITFNSMRLPLLVMAAIPFGAIGIILAFYLHGEPYSFLMLIGSIGMTGVVVNDSIVLVDFIKRKREQGMGPNESILEGGKERLRPVILTSVTTLGGLAPTAYQIGTGDPFLVPIALAIGWGLAFATLLTLVAIPCLYRIMDDLFGVFPKKIDKEYKWE